MKKRISNAGHKIQAFRKDDRGALNIQHTPVVVAVVIVVGFLLWLAANTMFA